MYKKICVTILILVVSVLLCGCGVKGSTYTLPPNQKVVSYVSRSTGSPAVLTKDMSPTDTPETYYLYNLYTSELLCIIKEIKQ